MRTIEKKRQVSRRLFLKTSSFTALGTVALAQGTMLLDPKGAWAMDVKALKPTTMATMIQLSRDIYPHDQLTDATYAKACQPFDDLAAGDASTKTMFEEGCAKLDAAAQKNWKVNFVDVGWEEQRVQLMTEIQNTVFFQTIRGKLVTSLYNQHDIWPKFGYEGSSFQKGGYLHRGFDDIDWLPGGDKKPSTEASL